MNRIYTTLVCCLALLAGCKKNDPAPAPAGVGAVKLRTVPPAYGPWTDRAIITTDTFRYSRLVNNSAVISWLAGYVGYSADSLSNVIVTLPYRPSASQDFPIDSNTYVYFYRYLSDTNPSFKGPYAFGAIGQKVHVEVRPDGKKEISFQDLDNVVDGIAHTHEDSTNTPYRFTGSFIVK